MRKLEARLEKVADEKWNEEAATEDEEATAGLSLYTPYVTPLPHSTSSYWESSMRLLWELPLPFMCYLFLPRP